MKETRSYPLPEGHTRLSLGLQQSQEICGPGAKVTEIKNVLPCKPECRVPLRRQGSLSCRCAWSIRREPGPATPANRARGTAPRSRFWQAL